MVKTLAGVTIPEAVDATERQGSSDLRRRVRHLARQRIGEGAALVRLDALLERARCATERRNNLLHGFWATGEEDQPLFRRDGKMTTEIPSAPELTELERELNAIALELNDARLRGFVAEAILQRGKTATGQ
jgi:hypothetical protein